MERDRQRDDRGVARRTESKDMKRKPLTRIARFEAVADGNHDDFRRMKKLAGGGRRIYGDQVR